MPWTKPSGGLAIWGRGFIPHQPVAKASWGCMSLTHTWAELNYSNRGMSVRTGVPASQPRAGVLDPVHASPSSLPGPFSKPHPPSPQASFWGAGAYSSWCHLRTRRTWRSGHLRHSPILSTSCRGQDESGVCPYFMNRPSWVGEPWGTHHEPRKNSRRKASTTSCYLVKIIMLKYYHPNKKREGRNIGGKNNKYVGAANKCSKLNRLMKMKWD